MSKITLLCCFEGFHLPLGTTGHFIIKEFATYVLETGKSTVFHVKLSEDLWYCLPHAERAQFRSATEHRHKLGFSSGGTVSLWQLATLLNFQAQRYQLATFGESQASFLSEFVGVQVQNIAVPEDVQIATVHCGYGPHRSPEHVSNLCSLPYKVLTPVFFQVHCALKKVVGLGRSLRKVDVGESRRE